MQRMSPSRCHTQPLGRPLKPTKVRILEQNKSNEPSQEKEIVAPATTQSSSDNVTKIVPAQAGNQTTQAPGPPSSPQGQTFVYALGRVEPRFPHQAIEKEYYQAAGRVDATGLTDRQTLHTVLSKPENRYLARQMCWLFTIEGVETYILQVRDQTDLNLLIGAVRPVPRLTDVDVILGVLGPIAPPEMCNGINVPIVVVDQLYSFDIDSLIKSIPKSEKIEAKHFATAAEELFLRIMQVADNAGATDSYRALNYLAVRYPAIYITAAEAYARNSSLTSVSVLPSPLSGVRNIVDVIFSFTNRQTDVIEKYFARVDVSEEFPFLVTKMSPYFDHL